MKNNIIYCETHKCPISMSGCIKRQKRAKSGAFIKEWGILKQVPYDYRCGDCEQGKQLKKESL